MSVAAARSVATGDDDRAADGMEKALKSFQTVEEKSCSLSRFKNDLGRKNHPKADCLVSA